MSWWNLKAKFFGPNHSLFSPEQNPHSFPDHWELPEGTEEVDENGVPVAKVAEEPAPEPELELENEEPSVSKL